MTNAEADENERIFVEDCKKWSKELQQERTKKLSLLNNFYVGQRVAKSHMLELLEEKNQQAAKMPAYPRD